MECVNLAPSPTPGELSEVKWGEMKVSGAIFAPLSLMGISLRP